MVSSGTGKSGAIFDDFIDEYPDVKFIRFYWIDFSARLRTKIVTRSFCRELALKEGSFLSIGSNCMNKVVDTSCSAGGLRCGTDELHPDWQSLRHCPHFPGHASVLCDVRHIGDNFESCPRTNLKRLLDRLQKLSITTAIGFEIEFAVFEGTLDALQSIEVATGWLDSAVFRSKYLTLLEDLVLALQSSGIPVREFHAEGDSKGTFEIILGHRDPLQAIDDFFRAQDIIKTIGYNQGLYITMTPRPFTDDDHFEENRTATQGSHAHISIQPTEHEDAFMAGILKNLPLLCAFGMASVDSYFRSDELVEEAAGHWVGWGYQNRYLPIRKIDRGHWELRYLDATANMYLVMATTLAAGLHGLEKKQRLVWKDCQKVPSEMTKKELADHGMTTRIPRSLLDSIAILESQKGVLGGYMAPIVIQAFENIKKKELEVVGKWTPEERRKFYVRVF